jgi:cyclohexadieny/prephenate dehydrogenase
MSKSPVRPQKFKFERLALIGAGLIGSSIARAASAKGLAREIRCTSRSAKTRDKLRALRLGVTVLDNPAACVEGADLVIVCAPLGAYEAIAKRIAGHLKPGAILTDVGSAKMTVFATLGPAAAKGVHFIPGHPVAGTEHSGPEAGFAELFQNRWCILTPPKGVDAAALRKLTLFWRALGSMVEIMDARHHDMVLALTSHVPHLIAFNIVGTADDFSAATKSEVIKYSAGGFRDFTRIASSDPVMWRDVFLGNREAVLEMLGRFNEDLTALQRAIRRGDGDALIKLFSRTRAIRRAVVDSGQAADAPQAKAAKKLGAKAVKTREAIAARRKMRGRAKA